MEAYKMLAICKADMNRHVAISYLIWGCYSIVSLFKDVAVNRPQNSQHASRRPTGGTHLI